MTVGRKKLREYFNEEDVLRIMKKAYDLNGVEYFDKMTTDAAGKIVSAPHFRVEEWLNAQRKHIKEMRSDFVEVNRKLYERVFAMYEDMLEEEVS